MADVPKPRSERFDAWADRHVVQWIRPLLVPGTTVGGAALIFGVAFDVRGLALAGIVIVAVPWLPLLACAFTFAGLAVSEGRRVGRDRR